MLAALAAYAIGLAAEAAFRGATLDELFWAVDQVFINQVVELFLQMGAGIGRSMLAVVTDEGTATALNKVQQTVDLFPSLFIQGGECRLAQGKQ